MIIRQGIIDTDDLRRIVLEYCTVVAGRCAKRRYPAEVRCTYIVRVYDVKNTLVAAAPLINHYIPRTVIRKIVAPGYSSSSQAGIRRIVNAGISKVRWNYKCRRDADAIYEYSLTCAGKDA
jgi:hypothetical protein